MGGIEGRVGPGARAGAGARVHSCPWRHARKRLLLGTTERTQSKRGSRAFRCTRPNASSRHTNGNGNGNGNLNGNANGMGGAKNSSSSSSSSSSSRVGRSKFGPEVGPEPPGWVKDLYQQQRDFPEETYLQDLLRDTGGDPVKIEANARRKLAESNITHHKNTNTNTNHGQRSQGGGGGGGSGPRVIHNPNEYTAEAQMRVTFEEVDCFSLWIWFEFWDVPSEAEREMLSNVLDSWFILGKLGSFNTLNLQLNNNYNTNVSFFNYDVSELESSLPAAFHEMEQPEFQDFVGRFWVDLGTCDELAIDVLINALNNFSREYVSIRELQIGGHTRGAWTAPKKANLFQQEAAKGIQESILQDLEKIFPNQEEEDQDQDQDQ